MFGASGIREVIRIRKDYREDIRSLAGNGIDLENVSPVVQMGAPILINPRLVVPRHIRLVERTIDYSECVSEPDDDEVTLDDQAQDAKRVVIFVEWKSECQTGGHGESDLLFSSRPVSKCLTTFLRIGEATDQQILDFIREWGVLGVWPSIRKTVEGPKTYSEPINVYRVIAAQLRAVLLIGAAIYEAKPPDAEDWRKVVNDWQIDKWAGRTDLEGDTSIKLWLANLDAQRDCLLQVLNRWLNHLWIAQRLDWRPEELPQLGLAVNCDPLPWDFDRLVDQSEDWPESECDISYDAWDGAQDFDFRSLDQYDYVQPMRLRPSRLFNVLVLQTIITLTSRYGVYRCDQCGEPVADAPRRFRWDKAKLCSDSCRAARHADIQARSAARRKQNGTS